MTNIEKGGASVREKIGDGGPVFPVVSTGLGSVVSEGMTLREYFAAAALTGLLAGQCVGNYDDRAKYAFEQADALLKAREQ